jgi:hypothetical protein
VSRDPFEYAVLRVVPRIDRGESMNAGVLLYCQARSFVGARVHLDRDRLRALDPSADLPAVEHALRTAAGICDGDSASGPAGEEDPGRRFRWLTAPRSTVVQPGPVHTGLTSDPESELEHLLRVLVLPAS